MRSPGGPEQTDDDAYYGVAVVLRQSHRPAFLANRVRSPNAIRMPPNFSWRFRRQAASKSFGQDSPPRSVWRVEDAVVHQGGVALVGQPQVSVRSLLETSGLTTFHALNSVMALLRVQGGHESEAERRQPNHS